MKRSIGIICAVVFAGALTGCPLFGQDGEANIPDQVDVTLSFSSVDSSWGNIHVSWIEGAAGNVLQNLFVCERLVNGYSLTGTVLPYWSTEKIDSAPYDGLTGASVDAQGYPDPFVVTRTFVPGETRYIRVCFEVDRSRNENGYFVDKPCYIFRTGLIDLTELQGEYDLTLYGWMSTETDSGQYSQWPNDLEPFGVDGDGQTNFQILNLYTDYNYMVAETTDLVTSLSVQIE